MQITRENFESVSLNDWQQSFYDLYGHIDRDLPLYDIMLQIVADSTRIAEAMRRGSYNIALPYIPRVFSWLNSMTSKVARDGQYRDIGGNKTLAWIIHQVSSQKRKDALKGMMNTGFPDPAFPFGASIA